MDKRILSALIERSITNNKLDSKKVERIANDLSRKQLKAYIDGLKKWLEKNTVTVESALKLSQATKDEYKKTFGQKEVIFRQNPDLIVGTRITDNDMIYEFNLQDTLKHIQEHITQD